MVFDVRRGLPLTAVAGFGFGCALDAIRGCGGRRYVGRAVGSVGWGGVRIGIGIGVGRDIWTRLVGKYICVVRK